jgi:hypothetical protein
MVDFSDLESNPEQLMAETRAPRADRQKFPCQNCGGTGLYRGVRLHQAESHCFTCNGRGYFLTSARDRAKAREQRRDRKIRQAAEALALFDESYPGVREYLVGAAQWSGFAGSLLEQLNSRQSLSEKQVASVRSMMAKAEARKAEREALKVEVDLSSIIEMFDAAAASGYKRPCYRAEGIRIKNGREVDTLYVYNETIEVAGHYGMQARYEGKVGEGTFRPTRNVGMVEYTARPSKAEAEADNFTIGAWIADFIEGREAGTFEVVDTGSVEVKQTPAQALTYISRDPMAAALKYGRRTGRCSCCGRELTKHSSIDAGIGPICAAKWGL